MLGKLNPFDIAKVPLIGQSVFETVLLNDVHQKNLITTIRPSILFMYGLFVAYKNIYNFIGNTHPVDISYQITTVPPVYAGLFF